MQEIKIIQTPLPAITKTVFINGFAGPASQVIRVRGPAPTDPVADQLPAGAVGLNFFSAGADNSRVFSLGVIDFPGDGIRLRDVASVQIGSPQPGGSVVALRNGLNPVFNTEAAGIHIMGERAKQNTVRACFLGTNTTSDAGLGNKNGVLIDNNASDNTIGGLDDAERNIISGNVYVGVYVREANGNTILGNYIGTDVHGTARLKNYRGVYIYRGANNTVGAIVATNKGVIEKPANVISGNDWDGVLIEGLPSTGNKLLGNFIGTDKTGKVKLGNSGWGVRLLDGPSQNIIGAPPAGALNVLSGNFFTGVSIIGPVATGNRIENNNIGIGPDPTDKTLNLANGNYGIDFGSAPSARGNFVKSNRIHHNPTPIGREQGNKILDPNSITFEGVGSGIDNGTMEGVPVIDSAVASNNQITISGSLTHTPNSTFTLEFFGNLVDRRQGDVFLGDHTVTTDAQGYVEFDVTFSAVYGSHVTATSTGVEEDGWTSEFSLARQVTGQSTYAAVGDRAWRDLNRDGLQDQGEPGLAGVQVNLTQTDGPYSAQATTDANGNYLFANVPAGRYVIQFTAPDGYDFTASYQGDAIFDSDADPADGSTAEFTLLAGQVDPTIDAGFVSLPPVATDDAASTPANTPAAINVLANDSDPEDGTLTVISVTQPGQGSAVINGDNTVTYTPPTDFVGTATFSCTIEDPSGETASATVTVTVAKIATTTGLTSSANPSTVGQSVTLTATVTPAQGFGVLSGTVTFMDGSTVLGTAPISMMNMASLTLASLPAGTHSLTAVYGGDALHEGSTSAALTQTVNKASAMTMLSSSQNPAPVGTQVTLTATVMSGMMMTPPTGTVEFWEVDPVTGANLALLGTATLDQYGQAVITWSSQTAGTRRVKALYLGDANYNSSFATFDQVFGSGPGSGSG